MKELFVFVILLRISTCHAATGAASAWVPHTNGIAPRGETLPTITADPNAKSKRSAGEPTPTSDEVIVGPTDGSEAIPSDGIDIYFGADVLRKLEEVYSSDSCKAPSPECFNGLANAMNTDQALEIEKRRIGSWYNVWGRRLARLGHFAVFAGSQWFAWRGQHDLPQPSNFIAEAESKWHVPSTDLAQWSSAADAPAVVLSVAKTAVTVPISVSSVQPTSTAAVTTLSVDASGHKSGDVLITIPTDAARALEEIIRRTGPCKDTPGQRQRRGSENFAYVDNAAAFVIPMAAPNESLHGFGLGPIDTLLGLAPKDRAAAESLNRILQASEGTPQFVDANNTMRNNVAVVGWQGARQLCVELVPDLTTIVLDAQEAIASPSETDSCPLDEADEPDCEDPDCLGVMKRCTAGRYKNCPCYVLSDWVSHPSRRSDWDAQQSALVAAMRDDVLNEGKCEAQITQTQGTYARGGTTYLYAIKVLNKDGTEKGNIDRTAVIGSNTLDVAGLVIKSNPTTDGGVDLTYAGQAFSDSSNDATKPSYCDKPGDWTQSGSDPVRPSFLNLKASTDIFE